ncbi:MAG TPA: hypothetical protein VGN17_24355 [Bryobacteraceae bacterium]|jgi:hypothetical protein
MRRILLSGSLLWFAASVAVAADTSFYISPCTNPASGCQAGDADLARWALQSWEAASQGKLHFVESKDEASSLLRFVWEAPSSGLYGETVGININGKRGSVIYIVNTTNGIKDKLLRDTIVYLTCLHEAGHALGLSHTDAFADIMYYFGYGGDIDEYFGRFRRKLSGREDIRKNSALSPADVKRLLEALTPLV